MSDRHISIKEMSAYLDGEARRPDAVRAHLERCAECARSHAELAKLSAHVRRLKEPKVSPAFATRVMAAVRETAPPPRPIWNWQWSAALGLAVVAVLAASAVMLMREPLPPPRMAKQAPSAVIPSDAETKRMMADIANRIAGGEDPGIPGDGLPLWNDGQESAVSGRDELTALAQTEWFGALAGEVEADEDVDTLLSSLSPEQARVFERLLDAYAREG